MTSVSFEFQVAEAEESQQEVNVSLPWWWITTCGRAVHRRLRTHVLLQVRHTHDQYTLSAVPLIADLLGHSHGVVS